MKKIIVPKEYLQCKEIYINPNTFEPHPVLIIDKDYYNEVVQEYDIKSYYMDTSYFEKWMNEAGYKPDYHITDIKYEIGKFVDHSKLDFSNPALKFIDAMYNSNKGYFMPIVFEVSDKEDTKYTVRDATIELTKRYKTILEPIVDIDSHLDKISNKNLLWMCERIINDDMPDDKLSRWIGFIQGVMAVKGYISVDEERYFSRPLFHEEYENNDIVIPETKEI